MTDCDLESPRHEKLTAWICARPTTDRYLVSVILDEKEKERGRPKMKNANLQLSNFFLT